MRRRKLVPVLLLGVLLGLSVVFGAAQNGDKDAELPEEFARPLAELLQKIDEQYVEEVDRDELLIGAMQGMLSRLDPYSSYMPAELMEYFATTSTGEFGGLGIEITFDVTKKAVIIQQTIPGTPAFRSGLLGGDMIVAVQEEGSEDTIKTSEFDDVYDAVQLLRGEPGTKVTLTILRGEDENLERKQVDVTRDIIHVPGVEGTELLGPDGKVGYIYIAHFHQSMIQDLLEAITQLQRDGAEGLILDLRFNPGGLLSSALQVASVFLDGKPIVRIENRSGQSVTKKSGPGDLYPKMPVCVLINRYSASASEIVAGALSDNERAVLVGERTHGKASVQQIFDFSSLARKDGIKLTIAHYYTPSDRPITKEGIQPDIEVKISPEDLGKLLETINDRTAFEQPEDEAPPEPEPVPEPETGEKGAEEEEEEFQDTQLQRAVEVVTDLLQKKQAAELTRSYRPVLPAAER